MPNASDFTIHIFPSDCDGVGHVNHAHLLHLLERARWAALEKSMPFDEYMKTKLWAVVRKVDAQYYAQSFPGDDFHIRTGMSSVGKTSFVVRQEVRNQKDVMVCEATIVYVSVSAEGRPIPVPDKWRELFPPWVEQQGETR